MTEKLKQLLHEQAESAQLAPLDADAIARSGDRRRRRRRGAAVAGLAATLVVAGGVASRVGGDETVADDPAAPAAVSAEVTWATGTTIHAPSGDVEVGRQVRSYVRTAAGYVVADPRGVVWSVRDGEVTRVGQTDERVPRLVSDDESGLAGWVDTAADAPVFVVLDQATGEVTRHTGHTDPSMGTLADEADPAFFYAIDAGTAYWRDQRGAVATDLDSGEARVVDPDARNGFDISDAEDGIIAFSGDRGTVLGTAPGEGVRLADAHGSAGAFSPDARWFSADADEPQVYDARSGDPVRLDLDRGFATGYEWLDDDTLVVIAARTEASPVELLTCEIPAGDCERVAELPPFDKLAVGFALPVGQPTG